MFLEKSRNPYATPFFYKDKPLQSGWLSKENYDAVKNSAAVVVSTSGSGRVISIADNPNFRAFWLGGSKLFMNAIFFGRIIDPASARTEPMCPPKRSEEAVMLINHQSLCDTRHQDPAMQQLLDEGFLILRGAAPAEEIAAIANDLAPRYEAAPFCQGGFYGARTKRFGRLLIRSPHMNSLVMHPHILTLAEAALGNWCDRIQLNLTQAVEIHPGALAQFPHRDQDMWQGSLGEVE